MLCTSQASRRAAALGGVLHVTDKLGWLGLPLECAAPHGGPALGVWAGGAGLPLLQLRLSDPAVFRVRSAHGCVCIAQLFRMYRLIVS